ncbi:MAG: hypothetical protein D8M58_01720 [Calditrichaeota bacterium]|nr:MAG: hypothetical protein DWQ03_05360 [Calditrichota bacterium]MBL1204086.1 hypothetical protein [Calditrichota bacterium]NOG43917.1 hypothetical protein [Calditrichota bacterium]
MNDLKEHQNLCNKFLDRFNLIQQKMLDLNLAEAHKNFEVFYKEAEEYFKGIAKSIINAKRGEEKFLLKKQTALLLKNIDLLNTENKRLPELNESQIILHFEKQLVFKKILKRQITHL